MAQRGHPLQAPITAGTSSNITKAFGNDDVAVRPSGIPGAGLGAFTSRPFKEGDRLGWYHCAIGVGNTQGAVYTWTLNATHTCDGEAIPLRNPFRYVNSIAGIDTCDRHNVRERISQQHG